MINTNIDDMRSYATEVRLARALANKSLGRCDPIVVCNREGRFTAIFTEARLRRADVPLLAPAHAGFLVIN